MTASVPPVTTAAPRRTRRRPPRVLFLECAGICSCAFPLPAQAPGPTIDADQGPAPRPGVPVAIGLYRMSARPPDHSGQPPRAGESAKEQSSSFAKIQLAPYPAGALILAWTLTRSCTPMELKPADRLSASTSMTLQDQKNAGTTSQPPRYPCRRLHGSSLARSGAAIPSDRQNAPPCYPQNSQTTSCTHTRTPADRPAQHRAALCFTLALASLDLGLCLGRPSAQTAGCGSLRQRQHLPPPSVQVFRTPAAA